MKNTILFLALFLSLTIAQAQEIQNRNLLSKAFSKEKVADMIVEDWQYFPSYKDHTAWKNLPDALKKEIIRRGDEALEYPWPILPASLYLEFSRNGNRSNFQAVYFERRNKLHDLVIAETLTQSGKYLDQVINGVWAICEESSWCIPAHISLQKDGRTPLPRPDEDAVDLFAAETGTTIAWTYYFLKEKLAEITPVLTQRMEMEMDRRILTPVLEREDFWWMGLGERRKVNNWNPWVISNWLTSVLLMEKDLKRKAQSVYKAMRCLDNFINGYPDDEFYETCKLFLKKNSITKGTINIPSLPGLTKKNGFRNGCFGSYLSPVKVSFNKRRAALDHGKNASDQFEFDGV